MSQRQIPKFLIFDVDAALVLGEKDLPFSLNFLEVLRGQQLTAWNIPQLNRLTGRHRQPSCRAIESRPESDFQAPGIGHILLVAVRERAHAEPIPGEQN